jgi:uncharacterized coiled-coil protein SlyX
MTIDERLEALTARHEALAQTVELIAGMQRENEKQLTRTDEQIRSLAELVHDLVHVAELHHERITRIEHQQ